MAGLASRSDFLASYATSDREVLSLDFHHAAVWVVPTVNHHAEEWVRGDVHTNSVEGVWSLLKRSIVGSYHHMSVKHLQMYLDEIEWRFNNRHNDYLFRDTLRALFRSDVLTYKGLTERPA